MKKSIMLVFTFLMLALSAFSADLSKLQKISNPTKEQAREFFNWTIETNRIARVNGLPIEQDGILYYPGTMLPGWTEFQSSQGQSLHVGNDSYTPTQPLVAYDKFTSAVERMGLSYAVSGVGEFDNYKNIFAQLDVQNSPGNHPEENVAWMQKAGSSFTVGVKSIKVCSLWQRVTMRVYPSSCISRLFASCVKTHSVRPLDKLRKETKLIQG